MEDSEARGARCRLHGQKGGICSESILAMWRGGSLSVFALCDKNEFIGILLALSWREDLASSSRAWNDNGKWELII